VSAPYVFKFIMNSHVEGSGWITDALSTIPSELHIPGYNYCGPNTKLQERLEKGDAGVNSLDDACKQHDIFYSQNNNSEERHQADEVLADQAWKRFQSTDAGLGEKVAAMLVTGAMKSKVKLGGGLKVKKTLKNEFTDKLKGVKKAVKMSGTKDVKNASKIAYLAAKKTMKGVKILKQTPRIIPIPKTGGILPFLIPLFAGLSATGALAGGASAIVKTVNEAKNARKALGEMKRHNEKMEAIAIGGKSQKNGAGFFLKPYKNGYGLVVKSKN
jgi:Phospholipase A2-like domain